MEKKINLVGLISFLDQVEPMFVDDSQVRLIVHDFLVSLTDVFYDRICSIRSVPDVNSEK